MSRGAREGGRRAARNSVPLPAPGPRARFPAWAAILALVAAALSAVPVSTASHSAPPTWQPGAATGWSNPAGALDPSDAGYASTSTDGATLRVQAFSGPSPAGTITLVKLLLDQSQPQHSDDGYTLGLTASGCPGASASPSAPDATSTRAVLEATLSCSSGWTWSMLGGLEVSVKSRAEGGVGGLLSVDGEWRVHDAWLRVTYSNLPPNADAGPAQSVLEGRLVQLTGAGSSDPEAAPLTYAWAQTGGPPVGLSGASSASPSFTAPTLATNTPATLTFELAVADPEGHRSTDEVSVTVQNVNERPVANAGADQAVAAGATVTLDGSGSHDPDSDPLAYEWTQVSGPAAPLNSPTAVRPAFTAPAASATLVFRLVAVDDRGASSDPNDVTITVQGPTPTSSPSTTPTASTTPSPTAATSSPSPTSGSAGGGAPNATTTAPTVTPTPQLQLLPAANVTTPPNATGPAAPSAETACRATLPDLGPDHEWMVPFPAECGLLSVRVAGGEPPGVAGNLTLVRFATLGDLAPPPGLITPPALVLDLSIAESGGSELQPSRAGFQFSVAESWIDEHCPATACTLAVFHRHGDAWQRIEPVFLVAENQSRVYEAQADGFSLFVVGGGSVAAEAAPSGWLDKIVRFGPWAALAGGLGIAAITAAAVGRRAARRPRGVPASSAEAEEAPQAKPAAPPTVDQKVGLLVREMRNNQELLQFVNNAAHDLANPLTPIQLQLHLLRMAADERQDERQRKSLGIVQRNVEQLTMLIQDLRDASKLQAGKLRLSRAPMRVGEFVKEILESYQEQAKTAGLALEADIAEDPPIDGDRGRLGQVLSNFLNNALKFTPSGGRIGVRTGVEAGAALVLVTDTGLGLTPEDRARLFQPFSQVHGEHEKKKGTGLGLFICKGIVEGHGGAVGCESAGAGKGSTFWFAVPLAAGNASVAPAVGASIATANAP